MNRQSHLRQIARYTQMATIVVVVVVLAAAIGVQIAYAGEARKGVYAFGVHLGGMDRDEATIALEAARDERVGSSLWLVDGTSGWELTQEDLGLTMDIDGALDEAFAVGNEGFGLSRLAIVWLIGGQTEVAVDRVAIRGSELQARINQLALDINQPVIHPHLEVVWDGTFTYRNHQIGRDVNEAATRENIIAALATGARAAAIEVDETQPDAYDDQYAAAIVQLENALDAPITLAGVERDWVLEPRQIAHWLTVDPARNDQDARVRVNEGWIDAVVYEIEWETDRRMRSPRVWWDVGGALHVVAEGLFGQDLNTIAARDVVRDAFSGVTSENRVELPIAVFDPPQLPANLNDLGIRSLIAEASSPYGGGAVPERGHNIELAARLINGTLVMPGQAFSFNAEIGPMTTDAGFQIAYGIAADGNDVRTVPSEAGGICQVSTTVFQPVFWSGYQIEVRSTHSFWIPTYTSQGYVGLDATVDTTIGMDFVWRNTTEHAVLIGAETDGEHLTIRLYGTPPDWTVEVDPPIIDNIVEPEDEDVEQEEPSLAEGHRLQIERAHDGFDVRIVRRVYESDGNVRELVFATTYEPSRNVILVGNGGAPPSDP